MGRKTTIEFTQYGEDYSEKTFLGVSQKRGSHRTLKVSSDDPQVIAAITAAAAKSMGGVPSSFTSLPESKNLASLSPSAALSPSSLKSALPASSQTARKRFLFW